MHTSVMCAMCEQDIEHMRHVFVKCQYAKACRESLGVGFDLTEVEILASWALHKLESESEERVVCIKKALWGIWFVRNKQVWEEQKMNPTVAMEVVSRMVAEWVAAQEKSQVLMKATEGSSRVGWKPPEAGWHKLNVDAAIHEGDSFFNVGMIFKK